jgi:predicted homoserine dehydrogenase-like protein
MYLAELRSRPSPIRVGVVGIGSMGRGVVDQVATMPGMRVMAAADVDVGRAEACLRENGTDPLVTDQLGPAQDALQLGRPVATGDAGLLEQLSLDAIVESTGVPEVGARVAADAIENGLHVVMLNVEADVVVGPILAERARRAGVVYTLAAGDQPGAIFELGEWAQTLGFRVVCAGRGTVLFSDDHHATPDTYREQAERNKMNLKMYSSFRDGTKSQTEMAAVSNVLRMPPEVRGMHEPHCRWQDLGQVFSLEKDGGILQSEGVIDMANAIDSSGRYVHEDKVFPGIFVVVTSDHAGARSSMGSLFEPGFGGTAQQWGPNWGGDSSVHITSRV